VTKRKQECIIAVCSKVCSYSFKNPHHKVSVKFRVNVCMLHPDDLPKTDKCRKAILSTYTTYDKIVEYTIQQAKEIKL